MGIGEFVPDHQPLRKRGKRAGSEKLSSSAPKTPAKTPAAAPSSKPLTAEEQQQRDDYLAANEGMFTQRAGIGQSGRDARDFNEDQAFHEAMAVEESLDDFDAHHDVRRRTRAEDDARIEGLAREALDEVRTSLMMAFRFLDAALWHMDHEPGDTGLPLATNGATLYFDGMGTLSRFSEDANESVRDMLHTLLHCIFRHPFDEDHPDDMAWQVATDVVVEAVAIEMGGERYPSSDDEARKTAIGYLTTIFGTLTPPRLYRVFSLGAKNPDAMANEGITADYLRELYSLFLRDSHNMWSRGGEEQEGEGEAEPTPSDLSPEEGETEELTKPERENLQMGGDDASNPEEGEDSPEDTRDEDSSSQEEEGPSAGGDSDDSEDDVESSAADIGISQAEQDEGDDAREWEEIAKQMEVDLASYSKALGDEAKLLMANLSAANRKKVNYSDFLRRFSAVGEDMKINDDEFDYLYYTYGLKLYGNMPLVEPLEYKESNRIREFVIALDTSESTSGELVNNFVERTYDILRQNEDFGDEVNIHIIQCDTQIQSDTKITSLDALHAYMEKFWLRGMGGTDFRPVFRYVEKLKERGEFENLKGLLYFTDGKGTYPEHRPDYDVAFVFIDDGTTASPSVPPWAMKVMLDEERLQRL